MSVRMESLQSAGRLRRADAALAAWIARAFPAAAPEAALAAALAARAVADGHSALQLDAAQAWLDGIAEGKAATLPDPHAWCEALRASPAVHADVDAASTDLRPLVLDAQRRVYLRRYFEYEAQLAHALIARARAVDPQTPASSAQSRGSGIDPEQRSAIDIALSRRFTLVTGGPGTGKTHCVARILAALAQQAEAHGAELRIALAAPTGKAAARLSESVRGQLRRLDLPAPVAGRIPVDAMTVHRLLAMSPWRVRPVFDRTSPLPFDVVVVDEVSMVDLPLMTKLAEAVRPDARLILLGDPGQLSAVEAGNVLGALVEAAQGMPLRDCHVALARSHRFGAGSVLGGLARAIAAGDADAALRACAHDRDVSLVEATSAARFVDDMVAACRAIPDAADPAGALRAARGFRVLTALRHGPDGCIALDRAIEQGLKRHAGVRADTPWWRGRLVMVTANRNEIGLFNGDVGVAWPDAQGEMKVWFETAAGSLRALAPAALPPHEGAFALTVHKAQGSEFDRVVLVLGADSPVLTRELLYTGVTRAREGIHIYGGAALLGAGIARRTLRMTGLADRLREAAAASSSIAESSSGSA